MAERVLTAVIQEAYIQGISTRSVEDLVNSRRYSTAGGSSHVRTTTFRPLRLKAACQDTTTLRTLPPKVKSPNV